MSNEYPLVSVWEPEQAHLDEYACRAPKARNVEISFSSENQQAFEQALQCAEEGQQVLWIENTVAEAQNVFLYLAARAGNAVETGLIHSRFTSSHRESLEDHWVAIYGKSGAADGTRSARGRILIGTQVLEQSLDVDADFLVTRFCPSDMLFQLWAGSGAMPALPVPQMPVIKP